MALFSEELKKQESELADKTEFTPFAENTYIATIQEIKVVQTQKTDWSNGNPIKTEEMEDNVEVTLFLDKPVDGAKVLDMDGNEAEFGTTKFWFHPLKTGISKKFGPSKARLFLVAALGLKQDAVINLDLLEGWITNDLIGKQLKVYISLSVNEKGVQRNKLERFTPYTPEKK